MDQLKKLFKKNSLVEKQKTRRKVVRRSRSLPPDYEAEQEPPKPVYRGKAPLRASKIHYMEPTDRSLPNGYRGFSVLDISKIAGDEAAKDWWHRKQVETGKRQEESAKQSLAVPVSQRRRRLLHPQPSFQEFTRMAREDFSQLFATDDSSSFVSSSSSRTNAIDESFVEQKLQSDLRARYDKAYGRSDTLQVHPQSGGSPARRLHGNHSTMDMKSKPQVKQGPVLHQATVQQVTRRPSQLSRRAETGFIAKSSSVPRDGRNKPLPQLPQGDLSGRFQETKSPALTVQPTKHHRTNALGNAVQAPPAYGPPGWF